MLDLVLRISNAPHQQGVRELPWRSHILWRRNVESKHFFDDMSQFGARIFEDRDTLLSGNSLALHHNGPIGERLGRRLRPKPSR